MATTLIETIQKNLGYPELCKVDPNTQAVKDTSEAHSSANLGQAAIPAVLVGLYKYGNTDTGAEDILRGDMSTNWLDLFFTDTKPDVIGKVASYADREEGNISQKMEEIAEEAIRVIRENTPEKATLSDIKTYVAQQRSSILVYLPAELQISNVINDNTLDDRTNKMEGPMSNSMHFIEKIFSGSTTEKNESADENNKDFS